MPRQITLEKRITEITGEGTQRLQVWVAEYEEMDPNIFVWQSENAVYDDEADKERYSNVASVACMEEYPIDYPDPDLTPFYRKSYLDLTFKSIDLLNKSMNGIEADVRSLIETLNYLDDNAVQTLVYISGQEIQEQYSP
jgi:hypothetical protein